MSVPRSPGTRRSSIGSVADPEEPHELSSVSTLPQLAMSSPAQARVRAQQLLDGDAPARDVTYALHALAILAREAGELTTARRLLGRGLVLARRHTLSDRRAELSATLGTVLAYSGQGKRALETFDVALRLTRGIDRAKVEIRRGGALHMLGRYADAADSYGRALRLLAGHDEPFWRAAALMNRALANMALGRLRTVRTDLESALALQRAADNTYAAAIALENLGDLAVLEGRLPEALRCLEEASSAYVEAGIEVPEAMEKTSRAYLSAGLTTEARATAERAIALVSSDRDHGPRRATMLLTAAAAALEGAEPEIAAAYAETARRTYARLGLGERQSAAALLKLRAKVAAGGTSAAALLRRGQSIAAALSAEGSPLAWEAELLAGQLAEEADRTDLARKHFISAGDGARTGSALTRAAGWLARARAALLDDDKAVALRASGRGLDVLEAHALSLGSTELRARATAHGRDLAALALSEVAARGSARELLQWTERWRATVHQTPRRDILADEALVRDLELLRGLAQEGGTSDATRARLEERIRRRSMAQEGADATAEARLRISELLDSLGSHTALVSVVSIGGRFHIAVACSGRVRRFVAGETTDAREEIDRTLFSLRAAAQPGTAPARAMMAALEPALAHLQTVLLGPALSALRDGAVVLVPPARLHSAPWGAMPALRQRPLSVAPSAKAWLRAKRIRPPRSRRVALIGGPDLTTSAAEVAALASTYRDAAVIDGPSATCGAVLEALDGAWLAHIGAHGTFRGDNPMFSALQLSDGPLTVFDIERLRRPPYRLLLSACESGVGAPTGADELLGLASSLTSLGTAGLMASVVNVNDEATVPFSLTVHEAARSGASFAEALLVARREAGQDPVARATAYSFLALGAA